MAFVLNDMMIVLAEMAIVIKLLNDEMTITSAIKLLSNLLFPDIDDDDDHDDDDDYVYDYNDDNDDDDYDDYDDDNDDDVG